MGKILFDFDPWTGTREWFEDLGDDGFAIHTVSDSEPVIEHNKKLQSTGKEYWRAGGDLRHEATVPNNILLQWAQEAGIPAHAVYGPEMAEVCKRKLNNPDFKAFKTADISI